MTTPTDGVEGTQGKLFYWTRQGISLADFQKAVEEAIERIQEAGGLAGITDIGMGLITAETQQAARDIIDAASTAQAAAGGGGGGGSGGTIDLPIAITDVTDLDNQLSQRSLTGHHHVAGDLTGLFSQVTNFLASTDHATMVAALALAIGDITGITDVGLSTITAVGANLAARQTASRAALDAAKTAHSHAPTDVTGLNLVTTAFFGEPAVYFGTDPTVARPAELANRPIFWLLDGTTLPTAFDETKGDRWLTVGGP